jgi:hypothetical protein|tara:strand:- start:674 stop:928 length:255 start_codon:yes stop_codon:yes gene_type:complete
LKFIHKECDPSVATDRSLPYTAYLVEYLQDGMTKFDIVSAAKKVDIFDYYWDLYGHDFVTMTQTEGRANPKLWIDPNAPKKKKK